MFPSHRLNEQGFKEMDYFKGRLAHVVRELCDLMPEGREKSIFQTKVEEASFFGAKAIACKPQNILEVKEF
jgi:hypothetical protein